jgi:tetratricopeptide (TPR) repeat protein
MTHFRPAVLAFVPALAALLLFETSLAGDQAGKIPVTTSSRVAEKEFIEGRTLVDNLRLTDANAHFQKAIKEDPGFALAELYLAQTAPTAKEFWAHLEKASELSGGASEGERLWIEGVKAGAYANPATQKELYRKLVTIFPGDERSQTLLGIAYFATQEYEDASKHLEKAIQITPGFAPAYNQLGYAYRFLNRFDDAEKTFRKYTELIPDDPNPYDSYAELLLKMGRFSDAITQYRKALALDEHFANSYAGIAAALMYRGKHDEARAELKKAFSIARTDGERRAALFSMTITYLDEGNYESALKEVDKQYALGEKINDAAAMSGDLVFMGNILLEQGKADQALARFEKGLALVKKSNLAEEVKANNALFHHFNRARVALAKKNYSLAADEAGLFRKGAEAKNNLNQIRLAHEVAGTIALATKRYDTAITELQQASQQNPYNLYRLALAYQGKGMKSEAKEKMHQAAKFNVLPAPNFAYIRTKAEKALPAI